MPRRSFESESEFERRLVELRQVQPPALSKVQAALCRIEQHVALIERSYPLNFDQEVLRIERDLDAGHFVCPRFVYRPCDMDFHRTLVELQSLRLGLAGFGKGTRWSLIAELLDGRAEELGLEARLVVEREKSAFVAARSARFTPLKDSDQALALAHAWLAELEDQSVDTEPSVHLASYLNRRVSEEGHDFSIIERPIATLAAATHLGVVVQPGAVVTDSEAKRIWVHEVEAHVLPRYLGKRGPAPLGCGTRFAGDEEEGYALLLERRHGLMGQPRRRRLALRHILSWTQWHRPEALESTALRLCASGQRTQDVAYTLARMLRGGGLAREVVYLPAMCRVEAHLAAFPEDERWLRSGRVSCASSRLLTHWLSENSTTHGA